MPVALCLPRLTRPPPSVLAARAWRSFRQRVELGSVIINCLIGEHLPLYFPVSANIRHASFMMNASPCFSGRPDKVWTRCAQRPEETSGSFSYFILRCKFVLVTLGVSRLMAVVTCTDPLECTFVQAQWCNALHPTDS